MQSEVDEQREHPSRNGLYRGVDLTHRDSSYGNVLPDTITIYQGPIEEDCESPAEMAEVDPGTGGAWHRERGPPSGALPR